MNLLRMIPGVVAVFIGFGMPIGSALADDSCRWANDGECDDPTVPGAITGVCPPGTDTTDCSRVGPNAGGPNSCRWANDGECDDPNVPGHVTSACAPGTDANDCGVGGGGAPGGLAGATGAYSPWTRITSDQRQNSAQPGGVAPLWVRGEPAFSVGNYVIYTGDAGPQGYGAVTGIQSRPVTLESNRNYVAYTDGVFQQDTGSLNMYGPPGTGYARIFSANRSVSRWGAICVLPAGWPISRCDEN